MEIRWRYLHDVFNLIWKGQKAFGLSAILKLPNVLLLTIELQNCYTIYIYRITFPCLFLLKSWLKVTIYFSVLNKVSSGMRTVIEILFAGVAISFFLFSSCLFVSLHIVSIPAIWNSSFYSDTFFLSFFLSLSLTFLFLSDGIIV